VQFAAKRQFAGTHLELIAIKVFCCATEASILLKETVILLSGTFGWL
jgi:hypothetical protein